MTMYALIKAVAIMLRNRRPRQLLMLTRNVLASWMTTAMELLASTCHRVEEARDVRQRVIVAVRTKQNPNAQVLVVSGLSVQDVSANNNLNNMENSNERCF